MKSYPTFDLQKLVLLRVRYFRGFHAPMIAWMLFTSCTPNTVQPSIPNTQSAQVSVTTVAEINKALGALALHTALNTADYQIGPEDLLQITLFNVSAEEAKTPRIQTVRVSQQGLISLPLIGQVKVAGLTPSGLEDELRRHYDKYIHSPQVGILVSEYRQRVSVIGAVQKPGPLELTGPKTVIDILSMAGGVSDKAGTQVHIYRQGSNGRESQVIDLIALASNATLINANNAGVITMPVRGGDVIHIPPAGTFFVDGAVRSPGPYALGRRYSLSQALATAGGVDRDYYSADITIFRRKGTAIETIPVDFHALRAGSISDPEIEADDVIVVPVSNLKYVYHRILGQILGWGTSVAGAASITSGS